MLCGYYYTFIDKNEKKSLRINLARYYNYKTGNYTTSQINYEKDTSIDPRNITKLKDGTIYNKNRSAEIAIHVVPLNSSKKTNHIDYDPTIDVKHPPSKLAFAGLVLLNLVRGSLIWLTIWFAAILLLNPQTSQFNWYLDLVAVFGAMLLLKVFSWVIDRFHLISVVKNNPEIYLKLSKLRWKPAFILSMVNSILAGTGGILVFLSLQLLEKEQSNIALLSGLIGAIMVTLIIYILWFSNASRVATIEHSLILDTLRLTKEYTLRESWGCTTISTFTRLAIIGIIGYLNIGLIEKSEDFSISQADMWLSVGILTGLVVFLQLTERRVNRRLVCYFLNYCQRLPKSPSSLLDAYRDEEQPINPQMNNIHQMNNMNNMSATNQYNNQMGMPQQHQPINRDNNPVEQDYVNETGTKKIPVSIIQCPICHSEVKSIYNFCFECGAKLDE
jgi:hypothetical protein